MLKFPLFQDHLCKYYQLLFLNFPNFNTKYGIHIHISHWEAPKFSFNSPKQADAWESFYTRALDFIEALDINPDVEDQGKKGWRQIKMMFEDEDCIALQTLIDSQNISPEGQQTPSIMLKAIQLVTKEDVLFWHHRDELVTDLWQLPDEGIHTLSTCIITLVSKCRFPLQEIKEMMKLMVLQHAVKYHEAHAHDWIQLQDQDALTYQSLLNYCTQLEARCDQFKQAQVQGKAQLASITSVSATPSSLCMQSATTQITCERCGYTHPHARCPVFNEECYNCHNKGHSTALWRKPKTNRWWNNPHRSSYRGRSKRSTSGIDNRWCHRSQRWGRQPYRSPSSCRNSSKSRSASQDHHNRSPRRGRCSPMPFRYKVSHLTSSLDLFQADEGQLYTDKASDGHRLFHTALQLVTKQGCKSLLVKINPRGRGKYHSTQQI